MQAAMNPARQQSLAIERQMKSKTYVDHWRCGLWHVLLRNSQHNSHVFEVVTYYRSMVRDRQGPFVHGDERLNYEQAKRKVALHLASMALELGNVF